MCQNNKGVTADAAVAPPSSVNFAVAGDTMVYTTRNNPTAAVPYASLTNSAVSTVSASFAGNIATVHKPSGVNFCIGYVPVKSEITVPAMTEYEVDYAASIYLKKAVTGNSSANVWCQLLYFGNTSATGVTDQSSTLLFPETSGSITSSTGSNYVVGASQLVASTGTAQSAKVTIPTITYTNNTNQAVTYTAYFGFAGQTRQANGASTANGLNTTATFSGDIKVTPVAEPAVDVSTVQYNGQNHNFTFTYDDNRVAVTKAEYTSTSNVKTTTYDKASSTGTNPLDANGIMQAKDAGKYTLYFDILDDCGAVWDSTTNDQSTKSVSFTITPMYLKVPTISGDKVYTGSAQTFQLIDFNGGKDIKVTGATGSAGNAVTGAGGVQWTDSSDKFEATNADAYTISLKPRDENNYVWNDLQGGSGLRTCEFEITQKELTFTFTCSETGGSWEYGKSGVKITATENSVANDNLSLVFYYDTTATTLTATPDASNGKINEIVIPDNIANGKHTLYAVLNGSAGANANYKLAANKNTYDFTVTSGSIDISKIEWNYTVDGAAGEKIADGGELPFKLKTGSTTVGVQYALSVNIPAEMSYVVVDTSKYSNGYNGDITKNTVTAEGSTYTITVALKSTDSTKEFSDGNGGKSATYDLTVKWKIVKGTFDLSGVKWEYTYTDSNGAKQTKDYTGAIEFDDINYAVRIKESTLPAGLTLVPAYEYSDRQRNVDNYSASASKSDFSWNKNNFNDPDVTASTLSLTWQIKQKNLYTNFKYERVQGTKSDGTVVSFYNKVLDVDDKYKNFVLYEYTDSDGKVLTLQDIIEAVDMTSPKSYTVRAYLDPAATAAANFEITDNGSDPTETITTGSNNAPVYAVIDGVTIDGVNAADISVVYDGQPHFAQIEIVSETGVKISDFTVTCYKGASLTSEKFADGVFPDQAGEYLIEIRLGSSVENDYILLFDVIRVTIEKKEIALPTVGEIVFSGNYINLTDYLGGSYEEYKDIISISGDYAEIRNVSQSGYKARLVLNNPNYKWATPSTAETASLKLFAAKLFDNELAILDDSTVELSWNIAPLLVDASEMWNKGKEGATLNLPENINALITGETLTIGYRYYDDAGQYIESPELAGGKSFRVEAIFGGIDADSGNVLFKTADGNLNAVSDKISYTVPQSGAAAFFGSTLNFLKANWLWFVIGAAILLFLIILICIIASAKKKKKRRLEEEKAERERKEEERERREEERRREEREERMARMNQQQAMPQPQYIPQPMPQMQPQYMPQQVQPMTMPVSGGSMDGSQFALIQAELAAIKAEQSAAKELAAIRAEQNAARELAELKAQQAAKDTAEQQVAQSRLETQVANMATRLGGEQVVQSGISNGITLDKLTELIRTEVNNAFDSREKAAVTEKTENGAASAAATQVPPDAVMTTVTTTKIDTTKKPVQNAQATAARPVVRNYVAPMPVDDGRVFDVGGFYKPADPLTDFTFDDEEKKD